MQIKQENVLLLLKVENASTVIPECGLRCTATDDIPPQVQQRGMNVGAGGVAAFGNSPTCVAPLLLTILGMASWYPSHIPPTLQ